MVHMLDRSPVFLQRAVTASWAVTALAVGRTGGCALVGDDGQVRMVSPDFQEDMPLPIGSQPGLLPWLGDDDPCVATITCVCWSPSGEAIACGMSSGWVIICDARTGLVEHLWRAHETSLYALFWSPAGNVLVSQDYNLRLIIWERSKGTSWSQAAEIRTSIQCPFPVGLVWSPDGALFALACTDATVRVWASYGQHIYLCQCPDTPFAIAWHLDLQGKQQIRALLDDGTVLSWNLETSEQVVRSLECSNSAIEVAAWAPNGDSLALQCGDINAELQLI